MPLRLVRRPGKNNWYIRGTVQGVNVFETAGTDDEAQAEAVRAKREADLFAESVYGKKAIVTFADAAASYLEAGGDPRFLGREREDGSWSGLLGVFYGRRLTDISQDDLDRAARKLHPTGQPDTLNRQVYTPFSAVWNHAVANGWADSRTWRRPRKPKGTAHRPQAGRAGTTATTYGRLGQFIAAMSPAPAMVMLVLAYTGMRPIEAFALEAADVLVEDRWIIVPASKGGYPRGVPMHEVLAPLLGALARRGGRVLRTLRGHPYPLTDDGGGQCKRAIGTARKRTRLTDVSLYTARHTVSTQLVVNGIHPHVKDQVLGHAVTDMSRRYTHVPQAPLIEAINTLPVPESVAGLPWLRDPLPYTGRLVVASDTVARDRTIVEMRQAGAKLKEIAARVDVSESMVSLVLKKAGLTRTRTGGA
jgi:integrase